MKTVVSKTGIEVLYPCTVHLLRNGEILQCEYKSDHIGQDLLDYICQYQNLSEKDYWGLRFVDIFDQKHWLELDQLIRPQVKNVCPIHFHFRVKIYPPEPNKLKDLETKQQFFMQLRYDLITGKLSCDPNDAALILALILQYTHGDYNSEVHFGNYIKSKAILSQTFAVETKAIEIHKNHLKGLTKAQVEDLFLRMACQLEAYGIDPHYIEDSDKRKLNVWVNHKGFLTYFGNKKECHINWMEINKIEHENSKLIISMAGDKKVEFSCLDEAECKYIYRTAVDHLTFFTSSGRKSTVTLIGSEHDGKPEMQTEVSNKKNVGSCDELESNSENVENISDLSDNSTLVNQPAAEKIVKEKYPCWLSSKMCVIHVALVTFMIIVTLEMYSFYGKDIPGLLYFREHLNYIASKYI